MLKNAAINYMSMNKTSEAKEILLKCIKKEPQNIEVLFNLAQIYHFEKNNENARQLLEDAYTIAPNTEIANLLAQVCMELGDYNQANILFKLVNLAIPDNTSILFNIAKCRYALKDKDGALKYIDTVLKILPEHEEANEFKNKIKMEDNK